MTLLTKVEDFIITKNWQLIITEISINSFRNIGNEIIYLYCTNIEEEQPTPTAFNTIALGGLIGKATLRNCYVWARIPDDAENDGNLRVIPDGMVDPDEDIPSIVQSIKDLQIALNDHKNQLTVNIHEENKETIGLGNIPNAISHDPNDNSEDILATTKLTHILKDTIDTHINIKEGNPHNVTKEEVGLGKVENYPIATESEAKDILNNTTYMTPYLTNLQINHIVKVSASVKPQCILEGLEGTRTSSWSVFDCNLPPIYLQKDSDTSLLFKQGTKASYVYAGKIFITEYTKNDIIIEIPSENLTDGIKYIYADIDEDNNWDNFGVSNYPYKSGMSRDGYLYDFFNKATMTMYDRSNNILRRVYIGTIRIVNSVISEVIPVPIGYEYIKPILGEIPLGESHIFLNPFIDQVRCIAEVKYLNSFGPTYWNDQIGVIASAYPRSLTTGPIPVEQIVVQVGLVGYLACGRESGSPFASKFTTITSSIPIRVRIIKDV